LLKYQPIESVLNRPLVLEVLRNCAGRAKGFSPSARAPSGVPITLASHIKFGQNIALLSANLCAACENNPQINAKQNLLIC
jgi:hypothetical protein